MRDRPARTPRLFVEHGLRPEARLELPADAAHHAGRVLRLRPGDEVVLFDGSGGEVPARIEHAGRGRLAVATGAHRALEREAPLPVTLLQAVSTGERMDVTIQKAVELGVAAIQPLLTERSRVRLDAARAETKLAHWRRIAIAACEQCGRNRIPELRPARSLAEACRAAAAGGALRLLLSPRGETPLRRLLVPAPAAVTLAVGPEAGFGEAEERELAAAGFLPVRLGPRVLRTETAASAALAALAALAGDF